MKIKTIAIIFIILILIVGAVFLVKWYVDSNVTNKNSNIVSKMVFVKANDITTKEQIKTNFIVVQNESIIFQGETQISGLESINLSLDSKGSSPYFLNYGSEYYSNAIYYTGSNNVNLNLYKIGGLNINMMEKTENQYKLNLSVVEGQWRYFGFCIKWSFNYLTVSNSQYIQITPPKRFESFDKCYLTEESFNFNESKNLIIDYKILNALISSDYVNITFFDSDRSYQNKYINEDANGADVGGEDINYLIRPTDIY